MTRVGASARSTIDFVRAAQGFAMVHGRDYVVPEDIKAVAVPVRAHRLVLNQAADDRGAERVIGDILDRESVPTEQW